MMKLGGRCIVQTSRPSSNLGVIAPWVRTPKCGVGLRRWENQHRLSSLNFGINSTQNGRMTAIFNLVYRICPYNLCPLVIVSFNFAGCFAAVPPSNL